jgi:hypothetical protein
MKFLPLAVLLLPVLTLHAADPAPQLAERGKLLFSDDLGALNAKDWSVAKGKWEASDGALKGAELAADKHPGVVRHQAAFTDAIIQYDIKLDGGKMSTLSVNGAKGHICRILVSPAGFTAQKDDSDHDGPDVAVRFGTRPSPISPGEWHTVTAEIVGDTMVASLDGANPIAGSHEALQQAKTNFGFTISGETVSVRNLRVWEATAKSDAAQIKAKLISETPKTAPANPAARAKAAKNAR